jgi:dihydroneopterin aldolase
MTRLLASVTDLGEAQTVLSAGADIIDLKDPSQGALGALPTSRIRAIVRAVRGLRPVSATTGDLPPEPPLLSAAADAVAATGVDFVKVGLFGDWPRRNCAAALRPLTDRGIRLIGVLFADLSPDLAQLSRLAHAGFAGVMLDTANKNGGGLRQQMNPHRLEAFVDRGHQLGLLTGLAGSLKIQDVEPLLRLGPDYLGFRSALCRRNNRVDKIVRDAVLEIRKLIPQASYLPTNRVALTT